MHIFKFALHWEQLNIYLIKSQYKCLVWKTHFVGTSVWEEVYLALCCFWRITRPISLIKLKVVTKNRSLLMKNLIYFCFNWIHCASSVNLHHTVYFGNKPEACKEANCSCKKKEDQNHYHCITKVQNCTCCSCDLQFWKEVVYCIY